jgi:two-component system, chemotaxis family, protein-glutamate methylesterase/glutaminase
MDAKHKIKVLVIDDSLFMRQMISDIFNTDPDIEVVDTAINGEEGLAKIEKLNPDVVTLDYEMPGLNGIATLKRIMSRHPLPVVMISAHTNEGGKITLEALAQGAVNYVLKPSGSFSLDIGIIKDEIIEKVKIAALANIKALARGIKFKTPGFGAEKSLKPSGLASNYCVVIGSSTGGTNGVEMILESLPAEFPASLFVVQHMPEMFTALFANRLNYLSKITVKEGEEREDVKSGTAYIAPGGWHMKVKKVINNQYNEKEKLPIADYRLMIALSKEAPIYGLRPSIDVLMCSVSEVYGANVIGVILSGMGSDGTEGLGAISLVGGKTIAQDEKTSVIFGMPKCAIEEGVVDNVLPIEKIASRIMELIEIDRSR